MSQRKAALSAQPVKKISVTNFLGRIKPWRGRSSVLVLANYVLALVSFLFFSLFLLYRNTRYDVSSMVEPTQREGKIERVFRFFFTGAWYVYEKRDKCTFVCVVAPLDAFAPTQTQTPLTRPQIVLCKLSLIFFSIHTAIQPWGLPNLFIFLVTLSSRFYLPFSLSHTPSPSISDSLSHTTTSICSAHCS